MKFSLEQYLQNIESSSESVLAEHTRENIRGLQPGEAPPCADSGCIPQENRKYQIQHLWERHHQIKRLAVMGLTHKEIACELGITAVTVSNVLNSDLMQKELASLRGEADAEAVDIAKTLQKIAQKSVKYLSAVMDTDDAPMSIKTKIAFETLSRTGYAPQLKVSGDINHRHYTQSDIEELQKRAIELGTAQGIVKPTNVIDAEYTQVN